MSPTYQIEPHLKHPHIKFAFLHAFHAQDFPSHKHNFSELFIVTGGSGKHTVGRFNYPLVAGDVFVINGEMEHGFSDVDNLTLINLMFDHHSPIFESPELRLISGYQALFNIEPVARQNSDYTAMLNLTSEQMAHASSLLRSIEDEYQNAPPGFETMLKSLLRQFVITLSRYYQRDEVHPTNSTQVLSRALVFIEQHFGNCQLKVEDIAASAYISTRQLERLFKDYLQETPNQYLKKVRLKHAEKKLLQEPERSIQSIADECGFSDSNYFSKCFSQQYGPSPRGYRNNHLA